MSAELEPVFRKDYRAPDYLIDQVDLHFYLEEEYAKVTSILTMRRNIDVSPDSDLVLDGQSLELLSVAIDGKRLDDSRYSTTDQNLTIVDLPDQFELQIEVRILPQQNTTMMGLYQSSGNFCTQCEAEGFRTITYFLDRPDVMAKYTTTIDADKSKYPVLLSNGNRIDSGSGENGRHWVKWEDPFLKPSYLFALVAGQLECHRGSFTTKSGRDVELEIWVEPQNINACDHALVSLQKSMQWDEEVYSLEYDLDLYMIVAVGDFNMGAMENKGLNIFNTKYVLANPESATDEDYENIERVIAHEYFHNWTGNRVTCRDWFQLTLKEGLTVFRDQQFSADMTSAAVRRIGDVRSLRTAQFAEDAGPMAHPIRPESYVEMNNFYTMTVYYKGAEVIRMYHTLLGAEGYRKGMVLYFERHDGQAVECDDFLAAMADANERDLEQFARWYSQAGTPRVEVDYSYDKETQSFHLTMRQSCREVPDLDPPAPFLIPIRVGLIGPDGNDLTAQGPNADESASEWTVQLTESEQTFEFSNVQHAPVPSLLRGFSAPVALEVDRTNEELTFLMANDRDHFNRWDAGQELAQRLLLQMVSSVRAGGELTLEPAFVDAFRAVLLDETLDGSLKSLALSLPGEVWLGQQMDVVDVDGIHAARSFTRRKLAKQLHNELLSIYEQNVARDGYRNDKASIDQRRLRNAALSYLTASDSDDGVQLAKRQFDESDNMTDAQAALTCLVDIDCDARHECLQRFYERWQNDPLVIDKWFSVQALSSNAKTFEWVQQLAQHKDFTIRNPNRARSLLGAFAKMNQVRFHQADGRAYEFMAEKILEIDELNPQVAAALVSSFNSWKRFDEVRQANIKTQLERIAEIGGLSNDVGEIVSRSLQN